MSCRLCETFSNRCREHKASKITVEFWGFVRCKNKSWHLIMMKGLCKVWERHAGELGLALPLWSKQVDSCIIFKKCNFKLCLRFFVHLVLIKMSNQLWKHKLSWQLFDYKHANSHKGHWSNQQSYECVPWARNSCLGFDLLELFLFLSKSKNSCLDIIFFLMTFSSFCT